MNYGSYSICYRPLSTSDLETIHRASMMILEKTGFALNNRRALELFAENGAAVDFEKKIVRVTEEWVMEYLKKAPARVVLYGREEKHNLVVEPDRSFFGTGGTALTIYDRRSRERRQAELADSAAIGRLVDSLEHIDWYVLPVYPNELPKEEVDINRFYSGFKNSSKHIMGGVYGGYRGAQDLIELAQTVAGGAEQLKKRPLLSVICCTISPLTLESSYVDLIFDLVEAGIPVATPAAPIAGATSPVTLAGTLAQINAEAICGILLTQVIREGAPVIYSVVPTTANMRSMEFLFGAVENGIMNGASAQLAAYYNLPLYSTGGVTESKAFDVQNGYEKCLNNFLPGAAGAQLIHNAAGQIDSSMAVAYEQYILDNEIIGAIKRVLQGIAVTPETLAADLIGEVGPGGHFLARGHTSKHMRAELYMPSVAVRENFTVWERGGRKNIVDHAREAVEKILREHQPLPLPEGLEEALKKQHPGLIC